MKKLLFVIALLALAAPLAAQKAEGPPPLAEAAHNQVVRFLDLSEDQVAQWNAIYLVHREAEQPLQQALAGLQEEIEALFAAGNADPATLGGLVIERHTLGEELAAVHLAYHEGFVALLDEAQAKRLALIARADAVQPLIPAFK
nr:periplasmic heavy metal sensor [Thermoanaerobaculales bacterium]